MTVIATASNPRFSVSRVDIDRGGPHVHQGHAARPARAEPRHRPVLHHRRRRAGVDPDLAGRRGAVLAWPGSSASAGPATTSTANTSSAALESLPADALTLLEVPALAISSTDCRIRAGREPADLVSGARRGRAVRDQARPVSAARRVVATAASQHRQGRVVTASDEAVQMATVAARAAAAKLADNVVVHRRLGPARDHRLFVIASASNERQVNAIVDEVEEKMRRRRLQARPPRGRPRRPLDAARLRRHRRAHPAPGRARLLCA